MGFFSKEQPEHDSVSGLRYERPLFGILTIDKNMRKIFRERVIYEPHFCLYAGFKGYVEIRTPYFHLEFHTQEESLMPYRLDFSVKFGRTWHHIPHDFKRQGLIGLARHIKENW